MKVTSAALSSLLFVTVAACSPPETATEPAARPPVSVTVGSASVVEMAAKHEAGGIVRSRSTAVVASRVMAVVAAVHVRAGDRVRSGDTLVTLDRRDRQADARRHAAGVTSAEEAVQAAEADVRAAESAATLARATHDRMTSLHERRSATTQEFERATAERQTADAYVESARARLRAARASLSAAASAVEAADVARSDIDLRAPFDGVIAERRIDPGTLAVPGMPLLVVDSTGGARLEADVDEARASRLAVGQMVEVRFDTRSDTWVGASVSEIARVDPTSHAFLVKADLPPGVTAPAGTFGRLRFDGAARPTLVVPDSAVVRRAQLTFVFVVDGDGIARLTPVSVGLTANRMAEVLAGLREGDRVVLAPSPALTDGTRTTLEGARP